MAIKKKGLGKGLDSMFPSYAVQTTQTEEKKDSKDVEEEKKTVKNSNTAQKSSKQGTKRSKSDAKSKTIDNKEKKSLIVSTEIEQTEAIDVELENSTVITQNQNDDIDHNNIDDTALSADQIDNETEKKRKQSVLTLKISEVEPNRQQPRKEFNEDALQELAESVRQYGIIQPLIVQKRDEYYEIIAGERRWRAAKLAGLKEVPVVIKDYTDQEIMEVSLIENIQREDLNPIEEAKAYQKLLEEYGMKQDELAEKVSKNRTTITNALRLLKLDPRVRQMLIDEMISTGHARALLAITEMDEQYDAAQLVFEQKLSVRETEKLVKRLSTPQKSKEQPKQQSNEALDLVCREIENRMKDILGTKVSVKRKNDQKGSVEIEYYSSEELERIYELIRSIHN